MDISWNEIRHRAVEFSKEWEGETREDAEAKSFWDEFFHVFGLRRRVVASFEDPVKKLNGNWGFIDLFWPGTLLVEHKSAGESLAKAESQAMGYIHGLVNAGRNTEVPRYLIVSDFANIALHDLEDDSNPVIFTLPNLHRHVHDFAFIPGFKTHRHEVEDPINIKAVEILGTLHDALKDGGYAGPDLERFLVRILFCLFADDTGIFDRAAFATYIEESTREDGSDLGLHLANVFAVLNQPIERRQKQLDELVASLPYVNGDLFDGTLGFAAFNREMRDALIECNRFDWSEISPAVFGSLFQSVMKPKERRQIGAHYTSERDILKVVRSLFLDDLKAEFQRAKGSRAELRRFHEKLANLRFLDPACGCGNFLVITYRELRLLEIEVLKEMHGSQRNFNIADLTLLDVDRMYGIEIEIFPSRIAQVALWLVDHQMNLMLSEAFGQYFLRLPLRRSATIVRDNALRHDWRAVLAPADCSFVLGNPPFIGKKVRTDCQQEDMRIVYGNASGFGVLDYVCCWYRRAAEYIAGTPIKVGFVSTNSIAQGEQPGVLWLPLFRQYGLKILAAHRTFKWESEARGAAHVHVVIIVFANFDATGKTIIEVDMATGTSTVSAVRNISPYLVAGPDDALLKRSTPLCPVPSISNGSMPNDGGNFLFDDEELEAFLKDYPAARKFIRPFLASDEYLDGVSKWCLWLVGIQPQELKSLPNVLARVENVRVLRSASRRATTRTLANLAAEFGENRQPNTNFVLVPRHTSENRRYIPLSYFTPDHIVGDSCLYFPDATLYHFGMLSSVMHIAWLKHVGGRIKSDYRYSSRLVYNNYPWPVNPSPKNQLAVEKKAQAVLDIRDEFPDSCLADLYDPLAMPTKLTKAHAELDRAVDLCYRPQPFANERQRVEYLFTLYEQIAAPLIATPKRKRPN